MDHDAFQREAESRFGTVGVAMTANVLTFGSDARASDVALQLGAAGVAGAPVLEGGRVVGVVSPRDLLEREGHTASQTSGPFLRGERHLANLTLAEVMTREVVTAGEDWPLTRAIELMDGAGVNRLPVIDDEGYPVGVLARDDVLRAVARALREPPPTHPGAPRIEPD